MKLHSTRNPLDAKNRETIVELLNGLLALLIDLRLQVKQAHWNVRGPNFISLHQLFDSFAGELEESIDEVAERATALGGRALGTAARVAAAATLEDLPKKATSGPEFTALLADRYGKAAAFTAEGIGTSQKASDEVTADLFIETAGKLEKSLWILEATLDSPEPKASAPAKAAAKSSAAAV